MARKVRPLTTNVILRSGMSSGASGKATLPTSDPISHNAREEASCSKCDKLTEGNPRFCKWLLAELPPGLADDPDCEGFGPLGTSKGKAGRPPSESDEGTGSSHVVPLPKANKKRVDKPVIKPSKTACPKTDSSSIQTALKLKGFKGSVVMERICCGKPGCHCHSGKLHGPYPYLHFWQGGKVRRRYLSKAVRALLANSRRCFGKQKNRKKPDNAVLYKKACWRVGEWQA